MGVLSYSWRPPRRGRRIGHASPVSGASFALVFRTRRASHLAARDRGVLRVSPLHDERPRRVFATWCRMGVVFPDEYVAAVESGDRRRRDRRDAPPAITIVISLAAPRFSVAVPDRVEPGVAAPAFPASAHRNADSRW